MNRWVILLVSVFMFAGGVFIHLEWAHRDSAITGYSLFGVLNAALLGLLMWSLLSTRSRAQALVDKATHELNEKNEELKAVINSFPGMISWVDRELKYVGVNEQVAKSFNRKEEDFVGVVVGSLSQTDSGSPFRDSLEEFFVLPEMRKTYQWSQKTGSQELWFLTTLQKYQDSQRVMVVSIDITDQKLLEQEIEVARAKALHSSRLSALGEVAGGMAHEINNPLMIVYAKMEQLKRTVRVGMTESDVLKAAELIQKVEKTAERISKIIRGLRTVARDGENDPYQVVGIQSIISDTLELCHHRLKNKEITLRVPQELSPDLVFDCRATQVVQVLLNLINNAVDAVEGVPQPWIEVRVDANDDFVDFYVTDSGPGIPEAIREKIMQPFYTTKQIGKGTGLGLSISQGIAQSHGGSLQLLSNSIHTCFHLRLPRVQNPMSQAA